MFKLKKLPTIWFFKCDSSWTCFNETFEYTVLYIRQRIHQCFITNL